MELMPGSRLCAEEFALRFRFSTSYPIDVRGALRLCAALVLTSVAEP